MQIIFLIVLILLAIDCEGVLDTYKLLTPFPLDIAPILQIAVQIENRSNIINYYSNNSPQQATYAFFLSSGFSVSQKYVDLRNDLYDTALAMFMDEINNSNSSNNNSSHRKQPMVTIPVHFDSKAMILYYYENDNMTETVYNFLNNLIGLNTSSYKYDNLLAIQLEYRVKKFRSQQHAFKDIKYAFDSSIVNDKCYNKVENNIRDSSQILIDHLASIDEFNTFVINMRESIGRRENMKNQLLRSNLRPSFLMPGIDPTTLPKIVLNDVLHSEGRVMVESQVTCFMSHIQIWNQIVESELPFAIIFEDDVEINPNIKCLLRKAFQTIPANWSIIYLDYVESIFWPSQSISRQTNKLCALSILASEQPYVKLTDLCAAGNARSYVLSYQGALSLLKFALPIFRNVDVYLRDMIYHNNLNAYVLDTPLAFVSNSNNVPSDIDMRIKYVKIDPSTNTTVYTFRPDDQFSCDSVTCAISLTKNEQGGYQFR